ncbi:hypothetical protein [Thermaerobacter subterraneus]|uniref:Uncharacterized protein n=1 Tax=Thermaerobacter subterraneus DSM 13965 TaxID=867903 RepID=K6P0Q1_9FIRM|nr:hypothetical protein [Thermaerobacter subterraneus]EKP94680.1 hypothetical protein ThesuDRAFT_02421 [Thermaerobacter subterraneus DSM 13965]
MVLADPSGPAAPEQGDHPNRSPAPGTGSAPGGEETARQDTGALEAARALWRARRWPEPQGPWTRPVTREELARWLVTALVRPAPPSLSAQAALSMAVALGWVPPEWAPGGAGTSGGSTPAGGGDQVPAGVMDGQPAGRPQGAQAGHPSGQPEGRPGGNPPGQPGEERPGRPAGGVLPLQARDLGEVEARVLAGQGSGERAMSHPAAGVTLAEALPWFLGLVERAGMLFDGEGTVVRLDAGHGWIEVTQGDLRRILVLDGQAAVYLNGRTARLDDLRPGDEIRWVESPPGPDGSLPPPPDGKPAGAPSTAVAYVEGYRWILQGTVDRVDWRRHHLVLVLAGWAPAPPGNEPGSTPPAPAAGRPPAPWQVPGPGDAPERNVPPAAGTGGDRAASGRATVEPGPGAVAGASAPVPGASLAGRGAEEGQDAPGAPGPAVRVALQVEPGATVQVNGRAGILAALRPGDRVSVTLRRATGAVRQLRAARIAVRGQVVAVDLLRGVVTVRTGSGTGRWVIGTDAVILRDGVGARLADLRPGDGVWLALEAPSLASYVEGRTGPDELPPGGA